LKLEKLLQKNYFLHQSARDGYRSYLQAYASYSLKKIFDINALDLTKVGKSFGFSVPPRVNVNMGGGTSNKTSHKRAREIDADNDESEPDVDGAAGDEEEEVSRKSVSSRNDGKTRRIEVYGKKKVSKEVYKKRNDRQKGWSR
jgi:ATP-dependent RNA helicase DDX18/HAS1